MSNEALIRARFAAVLAATLLLPGLTACAPTRRAAPTVPSATVVVPDRVLVRVAGQITSVPLDDYVLGSVLAEVTPLDEPDAVVATIYEVQAIIARTYAVAQLGRHRAEGFDLCDTTHCQLYDPARVRSSRFAAAARAAVVETRGRILVYGTHAAEALFHADCGGATAAADAVWGGRSVPVPPLGRGRPAPAHPSRVAVPGDGRTASRGAQCRFQNRRGLQTRGDRRGVAR